MVAHVRASEVFFVWEYAPDKSEKEPEINVMLAKRRGWVIKSSVCNHHCSGGLTIRLTGLQPKALKF